MKKISKILIIVMIFNLLFSINISNISARITTDLPVSSIGDEFPDSYDVYLDVLKEKYPNWVFKPVNTNVDWNLALTHESFDTNNYISSVWYTRTDNWKRLPIFEVSTYKFLAASNDAVGYVMDPRNSLIEEYIFQFEVQSYSENTASATAIMLEDSPMGHVDYMNKYKKNGEWITMDKTYAQIINEAGQKYNINPIHLVSRIKQETSNGDIVTNASINGDTGYYNFYNIGATDSQGTSGGLNYAQNAGWDTPEKAIHGGAEFLANDWIRYGQNTAYFQKFDVNNPGNASWLFGSQYMSHIEAPRNESKSSYLGYKETNLLDLSLEFHIPVYVNMPESNVEHPDYEGALNTDKVYLDDKVDNGTDIFNIRSEPNSLGIIIKEVQESSNDIEKRIKFDRILKGPENGYDKIRLEDGREGYIFNNFVYKYDYVKVESINFNKSSYTVDKGNSFKLDYTINPSNAKYTGVTFKSSDTSIATVDNTGNVIGVNKGSATITITSEEGKTNTCTVNVIVPEVISLDKDIYEVYIDESVDFNVICDEEYTVSILDENIAIIQDGKIKGITNGETKIKAVLNSDNSKYYESNIKVKIKGTISFDDSLNIKDKKINSISSLTKVSDLKSKINTSFNYTIKDINGKTLNDGDVLGTGTVIKFENDEEYIIVINGDVNGDGKISSSDYVKIKNHIMETTKLNDIQQLGADYSGDNKVSSSDYVKIKNFIMNN